MPDALSLDPVRAHLVLAEALEVPAARQRRSEGALARAGEPAEQYEIRQPHGRGTHGLSARRGSLRVAAGEDALAYAGGKFAESGMHSD